jgi:hypothetical protein
MKMRPATRIETYRRDGRLFSAAEAVTCAGGAELRGDGDVNGNGALVPAPPPGAPDAPVPGAEPPPALPRGSPVPPLPGAP